jgi:hypothetical protein
MLIIRLFKPFHFVAFFIVFERYTKAEVARPVVTSKSAAACWLPDACEWWGLLPSSVLV